MPVSSSPLVQLRGVAKSYGGVVALSGVDLTVEAGSIHAILGENGAGKSTLIKILTGVVRADAGAIELAGEPYAPLTPRQATAMGIACVFQELSLIPDLSVAENIYLTEATGPFGSFSRRRRRRQAAALLASLGCEAIDPDQTVETLPLSDAQMVEIAKALAKRPRLLILDEATSALGERQVARLFETLRGLRDQGVAMLYISHRMHEIEALCDTCTVFRNGMSVATFAQGSRTPGAVVEMMIGRAISQVYPPKGTGPAPGVAPLVEVEELRWEDRLDGVSFQVRPGEIYGIGGLDGQGQRETLLALFGVLRQMSGRIAVAGQPARFASPREAIRNPVPIAFVPEDRRIEGLNLSMSIADNVSLTVMERLTRFGLIDPDRERSTVEALVRRLSVKAASVDVPVGTLSGGNQQKVVLAKWLAIAPEVILLCDPARGIDVGTKAEIYMLLRRLAEQGAAIVLYTTDYDELVGLCDRVGVFYRGRIIRELEGAAITETAILNAAFALTEEPRLREAAQ